MPSLLRYYSTKRPHRGFVNNMTRKLATIRQITELKTHPNADALDIAIVDGWQCVVKRGDFEVRQKIVYFEIDSWIPHDIAPFLSKGKEPREYMGVKGQRLRTIKLRWVLSQGLILPLPIVLPNDFTNDLSDFLNINKWEKPVNAQLQGLIKGNFPEFIPKTDQERIQNIFNTLTEEQRSDSYEVTLKLDGSSCTFYHKDSKVGVCSRNLDLKLEGNETNAFVKKFIELGIEEKLKQYGMNIAIQGELWGVGINGNWEGISTVRFSVFDIYDIDNQTYLNCHERYHICDDLDLEHVPFVASVPTIPKTIEGCLEKAKIPSVYNKSAEGVVYKSETNPNFSFKIINNEYLLNGGE